MKRYCLWELRQMEKLIWRYETMIELYVKLVIAGKRTCDSENKYVLQVPEHLKGQVLQELEKQGYDANGQKV